VSATIVTSEAQVGLIIREREPVNLEYPFDHLKELFTPNDLFYIRSHFKAPSLKRDGYKLAITGAVEKPFELVYRELLSMPSVTLPATLECAGNGRIFLIPQVKGAQWQLGAVSTAQWTGIPLSALIDRAGLQPGACEIVFEAADKGIPKEEPVPPGEIHYARSISVDKIPDVLIAYAMNGQEIPRDHGFPLRAIVPGHYGMASVKWLTQIRAVIAPFTGYWQTSDYAYWEVQDGNPVRRPLGSMALKSAIARPRTREFIPAGQTYNVFGAAWGGHKPIVRVELSTDDGATWHLVRFLDEEKPFVWRRWQFDWNVPDKRGVYQLKSRATDAEGTTQPSEHDRHFGPYVIHHTFPIEVEVR
jgi:DMSO/TMAO reductase YedYZ molybdopterin-dependent catalytic subunit